jgi:hypothetical protein
LLTRVRLGYREVFHLSAIFRLVPLSVLLPLLAGASGLRVGQKKIAT